MSAIIPNQDAERLHLLSIFHFIMGGLTALFACFPIFHLTLGISMVTGNFAPAAEDGPPAWFGWLFVLIPLTIIVLGWGWAACNVLTGLQLRQRKNYMFCFVIAALNCAAAPLGTILGVFTILVLLRPSVKALFGQPVIFAATHV